MKVGNKVDLPREPKLEPMSGKPTQPEQVSSSAVASTTKSEVGQTTFAAEVAGKGPVALTAESPTSKPESVQAVSSRPPEKANARYDYVVIGSGAGGAPLAARLAEAGYKVLVLERGDDKKVPESKVPAFHAAASEHPDIAVDGEGYFVSHFTKAEDNRRDPKFVEEKNGIFYPRGEGFGGSTRMNANIFVRVDDVDWDRLAQLTGDPELNAANMKKYFQVLEKNEYRPLLKLLHQIGKRFDVDMLRNLGGHGFDGWLETTRADPRLIFEDRQLLRIVYETAKYSFTNLGGLGDKLKRLLSMFDPNDDLAQKTEGLTLTPMSVSDEGRRNGPRDRLLSVADKHPDRLTLKDQARVHDVLLDENNEAIGVRYYGPDGKLHTEHVRREVIISAGAFETPAILMRSGIGPEQELEKLAAAGVKPKVVRPGVGESLSDRYEVGVVVKMKKPFELLKDLPFKADASDPAYKKWLETGRGVYATNGVAIAMQAKSDPSLPDPDLYIFGVPGRFEGYYPGYSKDAVADDHYFTWLILHENKGDKRGRVTVDAKDVDGHPDINFMYHHEEAPRDSAPMVAGIKMVRELNARFGDLVAEEVWPGRDVDTDEKLARAAETVSWGHHANGTAKMGRPDDPMAVVDSNFQVIGTRGLRVVDASVLPDNIGSFIVSGILQLSEKAADDVIETARAQDAAEDPTTRLWR